MERRLNRTAVENGIRRLIAASDYRLLILLYQLWLYILGKDDDL